MALAASSIVSTVIVGLIVFARAALAVRSIWRKKKAGGGCGCGCSGCSGCAGCTDRRDIHGGV